MTRPLLEQGVGVDPAIKPHDDGTISQASRQTGGLWGRRRLQVSGRNGDSGGALPQRRRRG
ncbi:MAG: hypothetical protein IPH54_12580 [Rhodoferax sp.]|nr:hypothetical protein [Rhodoferax sp.]